MQLVLKLENMAMVRDNDICFVYVILRFIIDRLASAVCHDRPSLAKVLWRSR